MIDNYIITTPRCGLRELKAEDIDALFSLYEPPEITKYTEPLYEREREIEYQANYRNNVYRVFGFGIWLVCDIDSGEVIGRAGVEYRPDKEGELCLGKAEMGYVIAADRQGQGLATEVCLAVLEYAREDLGLFEVIARVNPENIASVRVAEKCGMVPTDKIIEGEQVYRLIFPQNL